MALDPLTHLRELQDLVERFESQQLTHEQWDHRAHLAVACAYVWRHGGEAFERFKVNLNALNDSHGVVTTPTRGYHETITAAWIRVIAARRAAAESELALANRMLQDCGDKTYLLRYYTRDRLMSLEARYGWQDPDVEPLP